MSILIAEPDRAAADFLASQRHNFNGPVRGEGPGLSERWLGQANDSEVPLFQTPEAANVARPRSLRYTAPLHDLLRMPDAAAYSERFALDPRWGARDQVSVLHIPEGSAAPGHAFTGATAPQGALGGGGRQILLHDVDTSTVVWTGDPPWKAVRDLPGASRDAAVAAGTLVGVRTATDPP